MQKEFGPEQIPEKYFAKWLRIVELKIWIGFAEFVICVLAITGLTIFTGIRSPETLKNLSPIVNVICSLAGAGAAIGINKYRSRK
jgi:hypothetical protein